MHGVVVLAIFGFCLVLAPRDRGRDVRSSRSWRWSPAPAGPRPSYPVAERPLSARDPRRRALGARRPARRPGRVPALARRRGAAFSWRRRGVDLGGGREGRRPRLGGLGPEQPFGGPISVSYVWDAKYGGIQFSKKETNRPPHHRSEARALLAGDDARSVRRGPLAREPDSAARPALRPGGCRATRCCRPARWTRAPGSKQEVEVGGAPRPAHRRRRAAGRARRRPSSAASSTSPAGSCASTAASSAGRRYTVYSYAPRPEPAELARVGAEVSAGGSTRFLEIGRTRIRAVRRRRPRCARATRSSTTSATSRSGRTRSCGTQAKRLRAGARTPYGAVVAIETWLRHHRRLRLRRVAAAADRRPAAARPLRHRGQARLLPALRRRDGADAPLPRDPGARRRRLHERQARGRQLDRHRPQRARLGRGLVPRATAGSPSTRRPGRGALAGNYSAVVHRIQRRRRGRRVRPAAGAGVDRRRERARPPAAEGAAGGAAARGRRCRGRRPARGALAALLRR